MANRRSSIVPLQELKQRGQTTAELPGIPMNSGAAFEDAAKSFAGLSSFLGKWADVATVEEAHEKGVRVGLTAEQLLLRKDGTLAGRAYDKAAADTFGARLDVALRNDMAATADRFKDNPAALRGEFDKLKGAYLAKAVVDADLQKQFTLRFDSLRFSYERAAERAASARAVAEAKAAQTLAIDTAMRDARKAAFLLGGDPEGDARLGEESARVKRLVTHAAASGYISKAAGDATLRQVDSDIEAHKIAGQFERLDGVAAKQTFLMQLDADWKAGKALKDWDVSDVLRLRNNLGAQIQREINAATQGLAELKAGVDAIRRDVLDGHRVGEDRWSEIEGVTRSAGVPEAQAALAAAKGDVAQIEKWWSMPAPELAGAIAAERTRLAGGGSLDELARLDLAQQVYARMSREVKDDLIGLSERLGRVTPTALSPGIIASADAPAAFAARKAAAEQAGRLAGVKPQFFTRQERADWGEALKAGGPDAVAMIDAMARHWGAETARAALAELKVKAPAALIEAAAAHAAGGSRDFLDDVARAYQYRQMQGYKPLEIPRAKVDANASAVYGEAFAAAPAARMRAVDAAKAAFDARARDRGLSSDIAAGEAREEFQRALQEAAGASFVDGVQYGGVARLNGRATVLPTQVRAERFADLIAAVSDADVTAVAGNGTPLRASDLRSAQLVAVGDGRYRVARGDPEGERPQWFMSRSGGPWILDLNALEGKLRARVPHLYRGGPQEPAEDYSIYGGVTEFSDQSRRPRDPDDPNERRFQALRLQGYTRDDADALLPLERPRKPLPVERKLKDDDEFSDDYEWEGQRTPTQRDHRFMLKFPTDGVLEDFEERFGITPNVNETWAEFQRRLRAERRGR